VLMIVTFGIVLYFLFLWVTSTFILLALDLQLMQKESDCLMFGFFVAVGFFKLTLYFFLEYHKGGF